MDFEQNRREILDKLAEMRKDKKRRQPPPLKSGPSRTTKRQKEPASEKVRKEIIFYGKMSLFLKNMIRTLTSTYTVSCFDNQDTACTYCIDNDISCILLDMDEPTDWKMSTDVFTTIKTLNPNVKFLLFAKKLNSTPVQTLISQGAIPFSKPVLFEDLYKCLNQQ